MAVMWPRKLPYNVINNPLRKAECEVYRLLEVTLDDKYTVFYSRPWLGLKPDGEEIDGECDFVIAHPALGILAIEVKGGGISYDPRADEWKSKDRWSCIHKIKNPVAQAKISKYRILEKLQNSPGWQQRRVRMRHAVIFPDSKRPKNDLGPDMPLSLFCFLDDFETNLGAWVLARFGEPAESDGQEKPLGQDGIRFLENFLAHPFQLHVPLGRILDDDDKNIQLLTTQQYYILRAIEEVPRAAIAGGAGTGKTVLALEEARRCALKGLRTLFTCFNNPLAEEIKRRVGSIKGLDVSAFHDLCIRLVSNAGIPLPAGLPDAVLYRDIYPELLFSALCKIKFEGYDAIVVDEGQDFHASWWPALECLFSAKGKEVFRVFYDSNQRVYGNVPNIPADVQLIPIRLTSNMRNTQKIHAVSQQYYEGYAIEALGPEGTSVDWIKCPTEELVTRRVGEIVGMLIVHERVSARDLAVLFADETAAQKSGYQKSIAGYPVTRCSIPADNSVIVDTVRRFKGLESKVVLIVLNSNLVLSTELLYVATSRARTHLLVIGLAKDIDRVSGACKM